MSDYAHSTHDEILFLKYLGTHRKDPKDPADMNEDQVEKLRRLDPQVRLRLLKGYRTSMKHRRHWGLVDPVAIDRNQTSEGSRTYSPVGLNPAPASAHEECGWRV